jgi:hypothetical protein
MDDILQDLWMHQGAIEKSGSLAHWWWYCQKVGGLPISLVLQSSQRSYYICSTAFSPEGDHICME